jgi:hypothetical protein
MVIGEHRSMLRKDNACDRCRAQWGISVPIGLLLRTEDSEYTLLKLLELSPQATQREIASEMGVSLGKVNYCV